VYKRHHIGMRWTTRQFRRSAETLDFTRVLISKYIDINQMENGLSFLFYMYNNNILSLMFLVWVVFSRKSRKVLIANRPIEEKHRYLWLKMFFHVNCKYSAMILITKVAHIINTSTNLLSSIGCNWKLWICLAIVTWYRKKHTLRWSKRWRSMKFCT